MNRKLVQVEITEAMEKKSTSMANDYDKGVHIPGGKYANQCIVGQCYKSIGIEAEVASTWVDIKLPDGEVAELTSTDSMNKAVEDFDEPGFDNKQLIGRKIDLVVPGSLK